MYACIDVCVGAQVCVCVCVCAMDHSLKQLPHNVNMSILAALGLHNLWGGLVKDTATTFFVEFI